MTLTSVIWEGCYDDNWQDLITPESFGHPAKAAPGLIRRIIHELFERGAVTKGDLVLDCFGGIGTTCIAAAPRGLRSVAVELEPRFVALAKANVELHRRDWETMGYPIPVVLQGDSRKLRAVMSASADAVVASPPFMETTIDDYGSLRTFRAAFHSNPENAKNPGYRANQAGDYTCPSYESAGHERTEGQIGHMKAGDVSAVVSSPPYAVIASGAGGLNTKPAKDGQQGGRNPSAASQDTDQRYGESAGQLARMSTGEVDAVISSPPYEGSLHASQDGIDWSACKRESSGGGAHQSPGVSVTAAYPISSENIGNRTGETFWSAAQQVAAEAFAVLRPSGSAVWIVKAFVRDGSIQDFPGDWRRLCESVGFVTTMEVHASLVTETVTPDLFGGERTKRTARKSFFRRLYESKYPHNAINHEVVWFMEKPVVSERGTSHESYKGL